MNIIELGDTPVSIYASTKEMPARRNNVFQKMLLIEAGIGSDMEAVSRHFSKLHGYIAAEMKADALREAENMHLGIHAVLNSMDFKTTTFACLVASIGGEACDDISDEGLERTAEKLRNLNITVGQLDDSVEDVKKK